MIKAIKQFIEDRKLCGDNLLTIIDYLAILCAVLIAMAIVWCWM
nr:MAG TPA: hypothetical protein [Caudoviricetes sp.]